MIRNVVQNGLNSQSQIENVTLYRVANNVYNLLQSCLFSLFLFFIEYILILPILQIKTLLD